MTLSNMIASEFNRSIDNSAVSATSLKEVHGKIAAAKAFYGLKARSWAELADKVNAGRVIEVIEIPTPIEVVVTAGYGEWQVRSEGVVKMADEMVAEEMVGKDFTVDDDEPIEDERIFDEPMEDFEWEAPVVEVDTIEEPTPIEPAKRNPLVYLIAAFIVGWVVVGYLRQAWMKLLPVILPVIAYLGQLSLIGWATLKSFARVQMGDYSFWQEYDREIVNPWAEMYDMVGQYQPTRYER